MRVNKRGLLYSLSHKRGKTDVCVCVSGSRDRERDPKAMSSRSANHADHGPKEGDEEEDVSVLFCALNWISF